MADLDINIYPMPGYSLAIPFEEETVTTTYISDNAKEQQPQVKSIILKINPNPYTSIYGAVVYPPEDLKEGDLVTHETYGWQKFKHNGQDYRMIRHSDLSAIIKEENKE